MSAYDLSQLSVRPDSLTSEGRSSLGAPVSVSLRLVLGPHPRPRLQSDEDVPAFIEALQNELDAASDQGRLVARKLAWCVDDACDTATALGALDSVLRDLELDHWPSKPIVALVMSTHSLADDLRHRASFLRRARERLLVLGPDAARVIEALRDLKELGDVRDAESSK